MRGRRCALLVDRLDGAFRIPRRDALDDGSLKATRDVGKEAAPRDSRRRGRCSWPVPARLHTSDGELPMQERQGRLRSRDGEVKHRLGGRVGAFAAVATDQIDLFDPQCRRGDEVSSRHSAQARRNTHRIFGLWAIGAATNQRGTRRGGGSRRAKGAAHGVAASCEGERAGAADRSTRAARRAGVGVQFQPRRDGQCVRGAGIEAGTASTAAVSRRQAQKRSDVRQERVERAETRVEKLQAIHECPASPSSTVRWALRSSAMPE